jgi:hypothetical protein
LNGYIDREDDIRDAIAFYDAQGTQARRRGPDKRRTDGEFIVSGPDFLWCCDGHDKFRNYGIEIYAAVDAYSRRIQWIYVGNSNRRQISILRQMLDALKQYNRCPLSGAPTEARKCYYLPIHTSAFSEGTNRQKGQPQKRLMHSGSRV